MNNLVVGTRVRFIHDGCYEYGTITKILPGPNIKITSDRHHVFWNPDVIEVIKG
jgi:hypothetical protein